MNDDQGDLRRGYIRIKAFAWVEGDREERNVMTSITVALDPLNNHADRHYESVRTKALAYIVQELERYGLQEAIGGVYLRPAGISYTDRVEQENWALRKRIKELEAKP